MYKQIWSQASVDRLRGRRARQINLSPIRPSIERLDVNAVAEHRVDFGEIVSKRLLSSRDPGRLGKRRHLERQSVFERSTDMNSPLDRSNGSRRSPSHARSELVNLGPKLSLRAGDLVDQSDLVRLFRRQWEAF